MIFLEKKESGTVCWKENGMKKEIVEFLCDLAAGISIFVMLFFLYILMAALG